MARRQRLRFTILAEGKRDYDFARCWLKERYGQRAEVFRSDTVAAGRGSGEQAVRRKLPEEIRQHRRTPGENRFLVVVTDGDSRTAPQRRQQLEAAVQAEELEAITERDPVIIVVPCRNLETWFAWTDGENVDEVTDYKQRYPENTPGIRPSNYGKFISERCKQTEPPQRPPSIADALEQIQRLP